MASRAGSTWVGQRATDPSAAAFEGPGAYRPFGPPATTTMDSLTPGADSAGADMSLTVRQRIEDQGPGLVGRESERAFLHQVLAADGPVVAFVSGIGGVGKSTLLEAFAVEARASGAIVLRLDCGAIEPTPRGFLVAVSNAIGGELSSPEEAAGRLGGLADSVVLALDRYEV